MKNFETDQELENYLEGKDGISETYSELLDASPSDEIDQLILKAAQDSVRQNKINSGYLSGKYSIAASLIACILIGSLYLGDSATQTDLDSELSISEEVIIGTEVADSARLNEADNLQQEKQSEPQPERIFSSTQAIRPEVFFDESESPTPASIEINDAPNFEESIVTVSRSFSDTDIYYRDEPLVWLEELYYLTLEADDAQSILEAERAAFTARYPDIDIDTALQEFLEE